MLEILTVSIDKDKKSYKIEDNHQFGEGTITDATNLDAIKKLVDKIVPPPAVSVNLFHKNH